MDETAVDDSIAESMGAVVNEDGSVDVGSADDLNPMQSRANAMMEDTNGRYAKMAKWGEDVNNADTEGSNMALFDKKGEQVGARISGNLNYLDRNFMRDAFNPQTGEARSIVVTKPNVHNFHLYTNQSFNPEDVKAMVKGEMPEAVAHNFLGEQWIVNIPDDVMSDIRAGTWEDHYNLANKIEFDFNKALNALEQRGIEEVGSANLDPYVEARLPGLWNDILPKYGFEYTHIDQEGVAELVSRVVAAEPVADAGTIAEGREPFPQYQTDRYGDGRDVYAEDYFREFRGRDPRNWLETEYEPLPDEAATRQPEHAPFTGVDDTFTRVATPEIDASTIEDLGAGSMNDPIKATDKDGVEWIIKRSQAGEARAEEIGWRIAQAMDEPAPENVILASREELKEFQPEVYRALNLSDQDGATFLQVIPDAQDLSVYMHDGLLGPDEIAERPRSRTRCSCRSTSVARPWALSGSFRTTTPSASTPKICGS